MKTVCRLFFATVALPLAVNTFTVSTHGVLRSWSRSAHESRNRNKVSTLIGERGRSNAGVRHVSITRSALLVSGFTRDTSVDSSDVDVDAVNSLVEERKRQRKYQNFARADKIQEQLLTEHSVVVSDEDKTWSTQGTKKQVVRGSDQNYRADNSNSNVDVDVVNALVEERRLARKAKDFERADAIQGQLLKEHSVVILDRQEKWMFRGKGARSQRASEKRGSDTELGPEGHNFRLFLDAGPTTSSLSEEKIHSMLAERLQAKKSRDFKTADRIRYDLKSEGVYLNDNLKQWRADGVPFANPDTKIGGANPASSLPYVQSPSSLQFDGDKDVILELLSTRQKYKSGKDYANADAIRDELFKTYNVHIYDRQSEWSVGPVAEYVTQTEKSQPRPSRGYLKSDNSAELQSSADKKYVEDKINERTKAKRTRQYDLADSIRDELLADFDVTLDDKLKQWSIGGDFGDTNGVREIVDRGAATKKRRGDYVRRGGVGNLSETNVALVSSMLAERCNAKRTQDYKAADDIRTHLRETYDIGIDDRQSEWYVMSSNDYFQSRAESGARELTDDEVVIVQSKLEERAAFKLDQSYDAADAIRNELLDRFSVQVDDKTKAWKVASMVEESDAQSNIDGKSQGSTIMMSKEGAAPPKDMGVSLSKDALSSLTVVQLKEKLRESGKTVTGKKAELIDRLLA